MRLLMALALLVGLAGPADAQPAPRDIGVGDPLRRVLLDALRPEIERDLGQPVQFVVRTLRRQDGWAFAVLTPQTKRGVPIDFRRTRHAEAWREGMFERDGMIHALLQQRGKAWTLRSFTIGATDVSYAAWPDEFGTPPALFGLEGR